MKLQLNAVRLLVLGTAVSFGMGTTLFAQESTKPDNTKVNKRDRQDGSPTAGSQSGAKSDREITREIRRAITKDSTYSTYAKNVKIITQQGAVTLRGPVSTEEEKDAIGKIATGVAGDGKVTNELEVAPSKNAGSSSRSDKTTKTDRTDK